MAGEAAHVFEIFYDDDGDTARLQETFDRAGSQVHSGDVLQGKAADDEVEQGGGAELQGADVSADQPGGNVVQPHSCDAYHSRRYVDTGAVCSSPCESTYERARATSEIEDRPSGNAADRLLNPGIYEL